MITPLTPLEFQARSARYFANNVAVVDVDAKKRFTYTEFSERANRLANAIKAQSEIKPGQIVNILTISCHQLIEAYYGVVQAGMICAPIGSYVDPKNIAEIVHKSHCPILMFHGSQTKTVDAIRPSLTFVKLFIVIEPEEKLAWATDYEEFIAKAPASFAADLDKIDENSTAMIFYGMKPPGVIAGMVESHRILYLHALSTIVSQSLTESDVMLNVIGPAEANGGGVPGTMVAVGGTQVLLRQLGVEPILQAIQNEKITRLYIVPRLLNAILRDADLTKYDLSSLKAIVPTAAAYTRKLIDEAEEKFKCPVEGAYALAELSPVAAYGRAKKAQASDTEARRAAQSTGGIPLIGVRVRVVDEQGKDVAQDGKSEGEIIFRGHNVISGYYEDPTTTAARFKDGWYYTGDMGTIDSEGYVTVVGFKG